jgi:hypothetical protein
VWMVARAAVNERRYRTRAWIAGAPV